MIGIDSSVLIDLLRNKNLSGKLDASEDLCTSEIVVYEILFGIHAAQQFNEQKLKEFEAILDTFTFVFPVDRKASALAAKIGGRLSKEGKIVQHTDMLIAASLLANGCNRFLTKNTKDFERINELKVVAF